MLDIQHLVLRYGPAEGGITAIDDLSLRVDEGEFVVVLGPSGCGKSSLLKVASGLLMPTSGSATLGGRPITGPRSDVGMVFQSATLLPWRNVTENVLVPIYASSLPVAKYRDKAADLLKMVGLDQFSKCYPRELSGGMQQRVGIARGLIHDPNMLLMDEPFAALDAMTREFMMIELQRIWTRTKTSVLFITHSIPEAVFLADRVITLSSRPAHLIDEFKVDLPRPRTLESMADPRFVDACNYLRALFQKGV